MSELFSNNPLDRRKVLKGIAAAGLVAGLGSLEEEGAAPADLPRETIEGYTDQISYQPGDRIGLHISSSARSIAIEVARVGARRDVVFTKEGIPGVQHPTPENASTHGCGWPTTLELPVAKEWKSGYYSVRMRGESAVGRPLEGELFFVVRPAHPGRPARILIQLCTNTYNAYNTWGGTSFYGAPDTRGQGTRVSFERPYAGFDRGDRFTSRYSGWRNWEQPFVNWAEQAGYKLDFAANSDLEFHPEILRRYRLVLSVGHDEYWSWPMRDSLEAFIANGGNVAFFSGNTAFWQVRSADQGRALVSWKQDFQNDPVYAESDKRLLTGMWSNRLVQRPENQLTGVSFAYAGYHNFFGMPGDGTYTVHRPEHWIFAGTGLKRGDRLGIKSHVVGYECDGCRMQWKNGLPFPTHEDGTPPGFEILGTAPAGLPAERDHSLIWVSEALYGKNTKRRVDQPGTAVFGCYTRGGTVVTTGCTEWSKGLRARDPQVERITRNILDRLST